MRLKFKIIIFYLLLLSFNFSALAETNEQILKEFTAKETRAREFYGEGNFRKARDLAKDAYLTVMRIPRDELPNLYGFLDLSANIYLVMGQPREALECVAKSIEYFQADQSGAEYLLAELDIMKADVHMASQAYAMAARKYEDTLTLLGKLYKNELDIAGTLTKLGGSFFMDGRLGDAKANYERAIAIYEESPDLFGLASVQTKLAELNIVQGQLFGAEEQLINAKKQHEAFFSHNEYYHPAMYVVMTELQDVLVSLGKTVNVKEKEDILKKIQEKNPKIKGDSFNLVIGQSSKLRSFPNALKDYRTQLRLFLKKAMLYYEVGQYREALSAINAADYLITAAYPSRLDQDPREALEPYYRILIELYIKLTRFKEAEDNLVSLEELLQQQGRLNEHRKARLDVKRAEIYFMNGHKNNDAGGLIRSARESFYSRNLRTKGTDPKFLQEFADLLHRSAVVNISLGRDGKAVNDCNRAMDLIAASGNKEHPYIKKFGDMKEGILSRGCVGVFDKSGKK